MKADLSLDNFYKMKKFIKSPPNNENLPEQDKILVKDIFPIWEYTGKQLLFFNSDLALSVKNSFVDPFPTEIIYCMPYINPVISFQEDLIFSFKEDGEELLIRPLGAWIYGIGDIDDKYYGVIASNDIQNLYSINVTVVLDLLIKSFDKTITVDMTVALPVKNCFQFEKFTGHKRVVENIDNGLIDLPNLVDYCYRARNHSSSGSSGNTSLDDAIKSTTELVLNCVIYLCTKTLDSQPLSKQETSKLQSGNGKRRGKSNLNVVKVGWEIGSSLSTIKNSKINFQEGHPLGVQQDPQHRRAHFRLTWSGPGKKIPKMTFIAPYWTHKDQLGNHMINKKRIVRSD